MPRAAHERYQLVAWAMTPKMLPRWSGANEDGRCDGVVADSNLAKFVKVIFQCRCARLHFDKYEREVP